MKTRVKKIDTVTVLPLLLFAVFAICIILVLLTGAKVYKNYTDRDAASYDHRTVAQYVATRIRQSDEGGNCFVGDFYDAIPSDEGNTFFYSESHGKYTYYTRIYCHEGYLYELFSDASDSFLPSDGERLIKAKDMIFYQKDGLICVDIVFDDGSTETVKISVKSEEAAQ